MMTFAEGKWTKEIDVREFILANYTPYDGDESFLASPTENTQKLWKQLSDKMKIERDHLDDYLPQARLYQSGAGGHCWRADG